MGLGQKAHGGRWADSGVFGVREERTVDPCSHARCKAQGRGDETSVSIARVWSWEHEATCTRVQEAGSRAPVSRESTKLDLRSKIEVSRFDYFLNEQYLTGILGLALQANFRFLLHHFILQGILQGGIF